MTFTGAQIEIIAINNGFTTDTVTPGVYAKTEYKVVNLGNFKTAFFLMNNETFNYTFAHVYSACTDKKSKRLPKIFKI